MNLKETKKSIRDRMSLGVNHGIKSLEGLLVDESPLLNDFINYKSQYNDFKNLMHQNLLSYDQIEIGLNKIRVGLIGIIDQIGTNDLLEKQELPSLRNTESQFRKNNFFKLMEIHFENLEAVRIDLSNSSANQTNKESKTGRYAFDFIYKHVFIYDFRQPRHDAKFVGDIIGYSNDFFLNRYSRFEVYMKTIRMILQYVLEEEMEQDFYINILSSILSTSEMQCIFYYAISRNQVEFKQQLINSKILDKDLKGQLIEEEHWDYWK